MTERTYVLRRSRTQSEARRDSAPGAARPAGPARGLLALFLLATLSATGAATAAEASADATLESAALTASETRAGEGQKPVATEKQTLLVEARLPYLPTSNTIATKLPLALERTPANVGVVERVLFEEQDAAVLGDVLENVSGVNVQTGSGVFDFFVVRGFDSLTSGLVLTDGAPEPEVTFYPPYNTERVEVFKGPAGFLYGSNPLAGAVNIVRKQPVPTDSVRLRASVGSFDALDTTLDVNQSDSSGELAFRVNGLWREGDGYRDGREYQVAGVNPAFTWRPDDRTSLNVNLELVESDYLPDAGLPIVGNALAQVPRERSYALPSDFSEQDLLRFQIDVERRLSDRLSVRNKTYYRELDWRTDGTLINGVGPFFGINDPSAIRLTVFRSQLRLQDRQEFAGNQFEAVYTLGDRVRHRLLAGVEVARLTDDFALDLAFAAPIDLLDPVEVPGFDFAFPLQSGDTRTDIVAPYVIDQIEVSERLQLLLGARLDSIDFADAATATSRSDAEVSPMAGVVFSPIEGLSLYANAAESFAPPSARVAGERRPEESRQIELGVRKALLEGRLRATVALFEIERHNIAIPDDNGFTQQAGDQTSRGIELEAAADLGDGLRGVFSYAYTDSELTRFAELVQGIDSFAVFDRSGNRAAFAPEHLARFWLSKRLGASWSLGGGARYVGAQFIAEDNLFALDAYVLLDAFAAWRRGDWGVTLHLDNLTDEEYETRGFGSLSVIPGRPATARLGFEYQR